MKNPSTLILALLLAASLGACGGGGGTDTAANPGAGGASSATTAGVNPAAAGGSNPGSPSTSNGSGTTAPGTTAGSTASATWSVKDIGSISDQYISNAQAINNLGQIAGSAALANRDPQANPSYPVFLYENGAVANLGEIGMPIKPEVAAINDAGLIVGNHYNTFVAADSRGVFRLQKGVALNPMTSGDSNVVFRSADDVNNQGQIVGLYQRGGFRPDQIASAEFGGYLYDQEKMIDLKALYGAKTAFAINNNGHIVGANQAGHAYLLQAGVAADLGVLPGDAGSEAYDLNDADQVVGASTSNASQLPRAFLYANSRMTDLNAAGGFQYSIAFKINQRSQVLVKEVIGQPSDGQYHYWLYDQGKFVNLSALPALTADGWSDVSIKAINDQSQIIGYGKHNGVLRSFVLLPKTAP